MDHHPKALELFDLDGHTVIKEPTLITERWAQHFNQLLNRQSTISEDAIAVVPQRQVIKELDKPPTVDETIKAIKQLSSGKARGEDGIPAKKCTSIVELNLQQN